MKVDADGTVIEMDWHEVPKPWRDRVLVRLEDMADASVGRARFACLGAIRVLEESMKAHGVDAEEETDR